MLLRLSIGSGVCALLGGLIYLLGYLSAPTIHSAQSLLGERWYELELKSRRVGYLHTRSRRDYAGRWLFSSELRFALTPGEPITMLDQLVFEATPPYQLRLATHTNKHREQEDRIAITRSADRSGSNSPYQASIASIGARTRHRNDLSWQYNLEDYLAFETWLRFAKPRIGAVTTVPTLDFARLDIVSKKYRITDQNETGYEVENPAPFDYTSIQLDHHHAPVALQMSGLFTLKRTSQENALGPRSALQSASYYIPTDRRLTDHTRIERMVLGIDGASEADTRLASTWSNVVHQDDDWILTLHANPLSALDTDTTNLEETLGFPVSSRRIAALAREAVGDLANSADRVAALNSYVHAFLRYEPGAPSRSVLALLDYPVGDCTEFADLFTTLARSLGIPARTVFGLAYDDGNEPAFAFHAWNEVSVDGVWQSVDPTWNQLRVDATHIPLPSNQSAALQLITGSVDLNFSVREVDYFTSNQG